MTAVGRMLGFTAVAGMAFAFFAAVVLLPAWARLDRARADRDALIAQTHAYDRLITHKLRLIEAIKTDPMQTERLLMQQRNCHRPGEATLAIHDAPADPSVLQMLAAGTPPPRPASRTLAGMSRRVQRPTVRRGLLLLSGLMMLLAVVMFLPQTTPPDGASQSA